MPPGIPVATVGLNASQNAGLLAIQIMATGDAALQQKMLDYKAGLAKKIEKANDDLAKVKFEFKTN
jgi:5-(carboxyamino)imidazole ribonucleotide mutase